MKQNILSKKHEKYRRELAARKFLARGSARWGGLIYFLADDGSIESRFQGGSAGYIRITFLPNEKTDSNGIGIDIEIHPIAIMLYVCVFIVGMIANISQASGGSFSIWMLIVSVVLIGIFPLQVWREVRFIRETFPKRHES